MPPCSKNHAALELDLALRTQLNAGRYACRLATVQLDVSGEHFDLIINGKTILVKAVNTLHNRFPL